MTYVGFEKSGTSDYAGSYVVIKAPTQSTALRFIRHKKGDQTYPNHKAALLQKPSKVRPSALPPKFWQRSDLKPVLRSPRMCCLK